MKTQSYIDNQKPGLTVYFDSQIGRSGQDRDSMHTLNIKTGKEANEFLTNSYKAINDATKESEYSGTCALSAIVTPDGKLNVANLGDSQATLFMLDEKTGQMTYETINTLHNPDQNTPGAFCYNGTWRLQTGISVSKAFGDKQHVPVGLTHNADFYSIDLNDPKYAGKKIFLEVACDGAFEYLDSDDNFLEYDEILKKHAAAIQESAQDNQNPASAVNKGVTHDDQTDDITIFVVEIDVKNLQEAALFDVFDGHGLTGKVAEKAVKVMAKCVNEKNTTVDISGLNFTLIESDDSTSTSSTSLSSSSSTGTIITIPAELTQQFSRQGQEQPKLAERS